MNCDSFYKREPRLIGEIIRELANQGLIITNNKIVKL